MWQQVHPQDILSSALVVDQLRSEVNSARPLGAGSALPRKVQFTRSGELYLDIQRLVFAKAAAPKLLVYSCAGNAMALRKGARV